LEQQQSLPNKVTDISVYLPTSETETHLRRRKNKLQNQLPRHHNTEEVQKDYHLGFGRDLRKAWIRSYGRQKAVKEKEKTAKKL